MTSICSTSEAQPSDSATGKESPHTRLYQSQVSRGEFIIETLREIKDGLVQNFIEIQISIISVF